MIKNGKPDAEVSHFPARFPGASSAQDAEDFWNAFRLATLADRGPKHIFLVRWDELRAGLPAEWKNVQETYVDAIRHGIETLVLPNGGCVRYDDTSFLVICDPVVSHVFFQSDDQLASRISGDKLNDVAHLVEVWNAISVGATGFDFRRLLPETEPVGNTISPPESRPPPIEKGAAKVVLADADYIFLPMWDVTRNEIFGYICRPLWTGSQGESVSEGSPVHLTTGANRLAAIDAAVFRSAVEFVQNALDNYCAARTIVPIHPEILAEEQAASAFFDVLDREIWPVLENMMFEIVMPSDGNASGPSMTGLDRIAAYGCGLLLRVDQRFEDFEAIPRNRFLSIGIDAGAFKDKEGTTHAIEAFARRAASAGHACHVLGLSATSDTVTAVNAGFSLVGSEAIAPALREFGAFGPQPEPADILKSILGMKAIDRD